MHLNFYQNEAGKYAIYKDILYPFLALAEESGEFLGIMAKNLRGDYNDYTDAQAKEVHERFKKEAGDILWQLSNALKELDLTLEDVAQANLDKLEDRKKRDVIQGNGDTR